MINMSIDKKIIYEIERFRKINSYLMEQEALPEENPNAALAPELAATGGAAQPVPQQTNPAEVSPIPPSTEPQPADMEATPIDPMTDDDVIKIDNEGNNMESDNSDSEELDITDLVVSQQDIQTSQEKYFGKLFNQIDKMEQKLSEMSGIIDRLDNLEKMVEKNRQPTPQEKLELRTFDSYPFTKKLSDFFDEKQPELEKTKKNEYVLRPEDVSNFNGGQIKDSFSDYDDDENTFEA